MTEDRVHGVRGEICERIDRARGQQFLEGRSKQNQMIVPRLRGDAARRVEFHRRLWRWRATRGQDREREIEIN